MKFIYFGDPLQAIFDRDRKMAKDNFSRKIKATGCIYLPESDFREDEGHLSMRSCLQDAVINCAPRIVKYIDKQELYRQCPPRKVKDSNIPEIENTSCVRNVMDVTTVSGIERSPWGAASILRRVNDGVFICTYNVQSAEYDCWTNNSFVYDSHFKPLHQTKFCGFLIDNRAGAPIFVWRIKTEKQRKI